VRRRRPFDGDDVATTLDRIRSADAPDLASVPDAFAVIARRCLAADPRDRFADLTAVHAVLAPNAETAATLARRVVHPTVHPSGSNSSHATSTSATASVKNGPSGSSPTQSRRGTRSDPLDVVAVSDDDSVAAEVMPPSDPNSPTLCGSDPQAATTKAQTGTMRTDVIVRAPSGGMGALVGTLATGVADRADRPCSTRIFHPNVPLRVRLQVRPGTFDPRMRTLALASLLACASFAMLASAPASAAGLAVDSDPSAIIGGGPVGACDWPSTVFLENCTGTLIHPEIVVYAAHCGDDRERVWFGEDISSGVAPQGQGFSVDTEYCWTNPVWLEPGLEIGPSRAADFGFCKLARPVTEVPIVPPVVGCETTVLAPGTPVTLVGYGGTDQNTFAVKFAVDTVLHYIDDWGAAVIGGGGQSPCAGDSGGPAFVQMPDGTWRSFAIVSGPNFGNCGDTMWFATIHTAIPFIEAVSGIDVSVCHDGGGGAWNPGPACGEFPLDPGDGSGKSWADGCSGGELSGPDDTCGPAFDASEDLAGPVSTITAPEDRARFDTQDDATTYPLTVTAEVVDAPSGVRQAVLVIDGSEVDGSLRLGSPYAWDLAIPPGVWTIEVRAIDWADNESTSAEIVIGIDQDPPAAPEPSTSSGADESSSGGASTSDTSTSGSADTSTSTSSDDTSSESTGTGAAANDGGGCGCTSDRGSPLAMLLVVLGIALRRRSRIAAVALASACGGGGGGTGDSTSTTTDTTTTDPTTMTSSTTTEDPDTSTSTSSTDAETSSTDSSSTGPACEPGTEDCTCAEGFVCNGDLACMLDTCVPCDAGTFACQCVFEDRAKEGTCDAGLYCFGGLCASPQPCPYLEDGQCDEPRGSGACLQGTDVFDCCPVEDGVCEERSAGGVCGEGSDPDDCGVATSSGSSSESGSSSSGAD